MRYVIVAMFLLVPSVALAQQEASMIQVEAVIKQQLGELAFTNAVLRAQLAHEKEVNERLRKMLEATGKKDK